jgi:hypothetical protein
VHYLRGNAAASAVGLYMICRYLSGFEGGRSEEDLRRSLQVLRSSDTSQSEASAVLKASLEVGAAIGVIARSEASSTWIADPDIANGLQSGDGDLWPWFRGELLHRMMRHALVNLEAEGEVPDLILGLTWFLQLSPLNPLKLDWGAGPEPLVRALEFKAVERSEQWRPFQRWALALGLARRCDQDSAKVLIPDASTAITDQIQHLPTAGSARDWLSALRNRLPVLGSPVLVEQLPRGGNAWSDLPPGVVIGLLKLEKVDVLLLEPSDDAAEIVALGLRASTRQVGRISRRSKS